MKETCKMLEARAGDAAPADGNGINNAEMTVEHEVDDAVRGGSVVENNKPFVLIVDDDLKITGVVKKRLLRRGFSVATAQSGKKALGRMRRDEFDCVLLDLMLPDMKGSEVMQTAIDEGAMRAEQFVILTAVANVQNASAYMQFGAFAYLPKPFDGEYLLDTVERCCKGERKSGRLEAEI